MNYIEAVNGDRKWISGIFLEKRDAQNYFQLIPEEIKDSQIIKSVNFEKYPVYLVEAEEFYFVDLKRVREAINKIEVIPDAEDTYINIYEITKDFAPAKPGKDYMGMLKHVHVDNEYLERYGKFGVEYNPCRGDIVYLDFNPTKNHEQRDYRPAFVISPYIYNQKTSLGLFLPITSQQKGYPFEVALPSELKTHGVILTDQIKSLNWKVRNVQFVETVTESIVEEVQAKIEALLF